MCRLSPSDLVKREPGPGHGFGPRSAGHVVALHRWVNSVIALEGKMRTKWIFARPPRNATISSWSATTAISGAITSSSLASQRSAIVTSSPLPFLLISPVVRGEGARGGKCGSREEVDENRAVPRTSHSHLHPPPLRVRKDWGFPYAPRPSLSQPTPTPVRHIAPQMPAIGHADSETETDIDPASPVPHPPPSRTPNATCRSRRRCMGVVHHARDPPLDGPRAPLGCACCLPSLPSCLTTLTLRGLYVSAATTAVSDRTTRASTATASGRRRRSAASDAGVGRGDESECEKGRGTRGDAGGEQATAETAFLSLIRNRNRGRTDDSGGGDGDGGDVRGHGARAPSYTGAPAAPPIPIPTLQRQQQQNLPRIHHRERRRRRQRAHGPLARAARRRAWGDKEAAACGGVEGEPRERECVFGGVGGASAGVWAGVQWLWVWVWGAGGVEWDGLSAWPFVSGSRYIRYDRCSEYVRCNYRFLEHMKISSNRKLASADIEGPFNVYRTVPVIYATNFFRLRRHLAGWRTSFRDEFGEDAEPAVKEGKLNPEANELCGRTSNTSITLCKIPNDHPRTTGITSKMRTGSSVPSSWPRLGPRAIPVSQIVHHRAHNHDEDSEECTSREELHALPHGATLQHSVIPVLNVAKAGVTGIGIVGIEIGVNAVFELARMVVTMKGNKKDLAALKTSVDTLATLKVPGATGDLETRLTELSSAFRKMTMKSEECKALISKSRLDRYLRSDEYSKKILDIQNGIAEDIREFTFHGSISIEILVKDMAQTGEVQCS
ncbi:hypothetical protein B0H11DRAFT_1936149 [Mycena galericulata]|nr:hypothetical protein B0H11DRAFT_1936149 [Mycena galericulata]